MQGNPFGNIGNLGNMSGMDMLNNKDGVTKLKVVPNNGQDRRKQKWLLLKNGGIHDHGSRRDTVIKKAKRLAKKISPARVEVLTRDEMFDQRRSMFIDREGREQPLQSGGMRGGLL